MDFQNLSVLNTSQNKQGLFQNSAYSQPISLRRSVPQLYPGKCSLSLRLPVPSRTTGLRARPCRRASLLPARRDRKPPMFLEECRLASRPREGAQQAFFCFHQAMLGSGKPTSWDIHICGWEKAQKAPGEQSGGKQSETGFSQGLPGQASKWTVQLSSNKQTQHSP